ncbi:MAG: DUF308 domain-containing protein [Halobacteriota archaeon]
MTKTWMRALEIIAGIILLVIAVWFVFNPSLGVGLVRTLLAIGLIILGLVLVVRGATSDVLSAWGRILNVILGIIVLALGAYAIIYPDLGTALVIFLFALALLLSAIGRIAFAGFEVGAGMPPWARTGSIVIGVIVLLIAIAVIVWPGLGETLIGWLMALIFGLFGIELIASGASSKSG